MTSSLPPKVEAIAKEFSSALELKLLGQLRAVVLYGSAASGTYLAGQSDLNFLVEVESVTGPVLEDLAAVVQKYAGKGVATPMVADADYLRRSADVFPIEFSEMKAYHRVLFGRDPLENLEIKTEDLRRQAEAELKQRLLQLRRLYLSAAGQGKEEDRLLFASFKSLLVVIRALLRVQGEEQLLSPHPQLVAKIEKRLGLELKSFLRLAEARGGPLKMKAQERHDLILAYLEEVAALAKAVDQMGAPAS